MTPNQAQPMVRAWNHYLVLDVLHIVTDDLKDKDMPTKLLADLTQIKDKTKLDDVATCNKNKLYRKEMKKAKACRAGTSSHEIRIQDLKIQDCSCRGS